MDFFSKKDIMAALEEAASRWNAGMIERREEFAVWEVAKSDKFGDQPGHGLNAISMLCQGTEYAKEADFMLKERLEG